MEKIYRDALAKLQSLKAKKAELEGKVNEIQAEIEAQYRLTQFLLKENPDLKAIEAPKPTKPTKEDWGGRITAFMKSKPKKRFYFADVVDAMMASKLNGKYTKEDVQRRVNTQLYYMVKVNLIRKEKDADGKNYYIIN